MATRYLEILSMQRPFPFDVDENQRVQFSCNYTALAAAPAVSFEEEILKILNDAGLATQRVGSTGDTWIGPAGTIPATSGDGPFITIIDTGGTAPMETHDGITYERLSVQIVVRAVSYSVARTRALAIWRELDGKRNVTVAA